MATIRASSSNHRPDRAPPPTPIATGKGIRSAAVDDDVFSKYLETNLKVPDLNLQNSHFPLRFSSPTNNQMTAKMDLSAVAAGDAAYGRWIAAAAAKAGGFRIDGGDVVTPEEVREAVEAAKIIFKSAAARRRGLVSRFGCGTGEEICWHRSRRKEMEPALADVPADTYRIFRNGAMVNTGLLLERFSPSRGHIQMLCSQWSLSCTLSQNHVVSHRDQEGK